MRDATALPASRRSFPTLMPPILRWRTPRPRMLFAWGDRDIFLSSEGDRASVELIPGARMDASPGGHNIWWDDAPFCAAQISKLLAEKGA